MFRSIGSPRLMVVGDVCEDIWLVATERENPESSAPCYNADLVQTRALGMSAIVADQIRQWGADVIHLWPGKSGRKTRLVYKSGTPIFRYDLEWPMDDRDARRIFRLARFHLGTFAPSALALVDYGKGLFRQHHELAQLIHAANQANIPVLVDPARGADWTKYAGATLIKPNRVEWSTVTQTPLGSQVLLTQGNQEALLFSGDGKSLTSIAVTPRNCIDPCGAGDAVMAMLCYAIAGGVSIEDACRLSMHAGGLAVGRLGTQAITREQILKDLGG